MADLYQSLDTVLWDCLSGPDVPENILLDALYSSLPDTVRSQSMDRRIREYVTRVASRYGYERHADRDGDVWRKPTPKITVPRPEPVKPVKAVPPAPVQEDPTQLPGDVVALAGMIGDVLRDHQGIRGIRVTGDGVVVDWTVKISMA